MLILTSRLVFFTIHSDTHSAFGDRKKHAPCVPLGQCEHERYVVTKWWYFSNIFSLSIYSNIPVVLLFFLEFGCALRESLNDQAMNEQVQRTIVGRCGKRRAIDTLLTYSQIEMHFTHLDRHRSNFEHAHNSLNIVSPTVQICSRTHTSAIIICVARRKRKMSIITMRHGACSCSPFGHGGWWPPRVSSQVQFVDKDSFS